MALAEHTTEVPPAGPEAGLVTAAPGQAGCTFGHQTRKLIFGLIGPLSLLVMAAIGIASAGYGQAGAARQAAGALEICVAQHEDRWKQLGPRLQRIEDKIDRLIEGGRQPNP